MKLKSSKPRKDKDIVRSTKRQTHATTYEHGTI